MISLKISGIIMISLLGAFILKLLKPEYALFPIISAIVICITILLNNNLTETVGAIKNFSENTNVSGYIKILFKALGITYLATITSNICKSAGEELLSDISQTAGKFEILALCLPLATELVSIAKDLL